jgi:hypothetical protein
LGKPLRAPDTHVLKFEGSDGLETGMATYKFKDFLQLDDSSKFDGFHNPGIKAPYPGIYRCAECGKEIAIAEGHTLPSENHHDHDRKLGQGKIRWGLVVSHD